MGAPRPLRSTRAWRRLQVAPRVAPPTECDNAPTSRGVGRRGAAQIRMKTLDLRLYAWLAEPDERRFERAFGAYFAVAFPSVLRHLGRFSRWDSGRLEDLAQEALLRFFHKAGRGRREASQTVRSVLARLRPLDLGAFHERQVAGWTGDVSSFADSAMSFRVESEEAELKAAIRALADRIPPLQRQGRHLLQGVPAETPLCEDVVLVVDTLPQLRVPTNSYLFQIARSVFLDDCKSLGRQKRGGKGRPAHESDGIEDLQKHPLDSVDGDDAFEDWGDDPPPPSLPPAAADPAQAYENEELFLRFYEYLRRPVDQAADLYQRAAATGRAVAERRKLESLTDKLSRTLAVLTAIGEGHTQEQVAEQLDLSRNQVKYILELVQEAYTRFVTDAAQSAAASPHAREQTHVT
jgi:DNA-directed RNA polymerase specialized sigma24 family protein